MSLSSLVAKKPVTFIAVLIVLLGAAGFLFLPIILGSTSGPGYPLAPGDTVTSWSWQGAYKDNGAKEKQATTELSTLKSKVGKGSPPDYDLYVGIASEYELLGEGKQAYQYLSRAIALDPSRGLAYMNMGHLMEELGALKTALAAYGKAVQAEPNNTVYTAARSNLLVQHPSLTP